MKDLQAFIRDIPDFPKPGILFKDITPLLKSPEAFKATVDKITALLKKEGCEHTALSASSS